MRIMTAPLVRAETPGDADSIRHLVQAAFEQADEAELVDALREGGFLAVSAVAIVDDAVVAHAALSRACIAEKPALVLAPVSVHPDYQGRGLGAAVVNHILDMTSGTVMVLGDPGYYRRFGFVAAEGHGITDPTFEPPPGILQVLRPELASPGPLAYAEPFLDL